MNPTAPNAPRPRRGIAFQLAAVALVVVSAVAATGLARWLKKPLERVQHQPKAPGFPGKLFKGWEKPDFVLVLTAQQHGYLQPCGCSSPQVGGLERRLNFLKLLQANGWSYAAVDLGDLPQRTGPAGLPNQQGMIKYVYTMKALRAMNYSAVGFGEYEVSLGLMNTLTEYALNEKQPRVIATNLKDAKDNYPEMTAPWEAVDVKGGKDGQTFRLGVVSITGPVVAAKIKQISRNDPALKFAETKATLDNALKQLTASKVHLPILLYQGPITRDERQKPTEALACAEAYPQFPVILCLGDDDSAPALPREVKHKDGTTSYVVTVGHKGKSIGVVGVWKTDDRAAPYKLRYERVEMTEDFKTPKGKEKDNAVAALMEEYTKELRDKKYLERYGQVRHQLQVMPAVPNLKNPGEVEYVGSEVCKKCHEHAYEVWKKTPHSHAYQTLVDAKGPSNSQYDPECIVCHTVGFGYKSGYVNEKRTPKLKDVGCESCHGPSSVHVKNPNDAEWQKRVNPWRYLPKNKREDAIDQMCQKCHDQDNDVHWTGQGFKRKWPKVEHNTPGVKEDEEEK